MAEPFLTSGSRIGKDKCGISTIQLVFFVEGPVEHGGPEPYDLLFNFMPAAPMGLVYVDRSAEKDNSGAWQLTITFEGIQGEKVEGVILEYDNSGVEDPIETFERFGTGSDGLLADK